MSKQLTHTKLIAEVGREVLHPLGLQRKGRSRVWLDDRGWWAGVVEFQPSSWSRGSYLNVGAMWLWHTEHHIQFDVGHRVDEAGFIEYEDDEQFRQAAAELAHLAADRVIELRDRFAELDDAASYLRNEDPDRQGWPAFNAGVALALSGRDTEARSLFRSLRAESESPDWWSAAVAQAREFAQLLERPGGLDKFRDDMRYRVGAFRVALKLDEETDLPWSSAVRTIRSDPSETRRQPGAPSRSRSNPVAPTKASR